MFPTRGYGRLERLVFTHALQIFFFFNATPTETKFLLK